MALEPNRGQDAPTEAGDAKLNADEFDLIQAAMPTLKKIMSAGPQ
ncbi:hypothetical protein [Glutamicibacter uratoxydans]